MGKGEGLWEHSPVNTLQGTSPYPTKREVQKISSICDILVANCRMSLICSFLDCLDGKIDPIEHQQAGTIPIFGRLGWNIKSYQFIESLA